MVIFIIFYHLITLNLYHELSSVLYLLINILNLFHYSFHNLQFNLLYSRSSLLEIYINLKLIIQVMDDLLYYLWIINKFVHLIV